MNRLINKFKTRGTIVNAERSGRPKTATNEDRQADVIANLTVKPNRSLGYVTRQSGVSKDSVHRILKSAHFHPYKLQRRHTMSDTDPLRRSECCNWFLQEVERNPHFVRNVMFSDECLFFLDGHAHTQNCQILVPREPTLDAFQ